MPLVIMPSLSPAAISSGTVVGDPYLQEYFDGNLTDWTTVDDGTSDAPSNWFIGVNDDLVQNSNIYGNTDPVIRLGTFFKYNLGYSWSDVAIDFDIYATDNDTMGFMWRVEDDQNYYRLHWNAQTDIGLRVTKCVDGVFTGISSLTGSAHTTDVWYHIRIEAVGDSHKVYVDGTLMFDLTDSDHSTGTIAPYCAGMSSVKYDNIIVAPAVDGANNTSTTQINPVMTGRTSPVGYSVVAIHSEGATWPEQNAFNHNIADYGWTGRPQSSSLWIAYQHDEKVAVNKLRIMPYRNSSWLIDSFELWGSNDTFDDVTGVGAATWTKITTIDTSAVGSYVWSPYYTFVNGVTYRSYKIQILAWGSKGSQIIECELIGQQ